MIKRKRRTYSEQEVANLKRGLIELECKNGCGNVELVDGDTVAVTCSSCTAKDSIGLEQKVVKETEEEKENRKAFREAMKAEKASRPKSEAAGKGWQKGWWLKRRFEAPDGSVWCYGAPYVEGMIIQSPRQKHNESKNKTIIIDDGVPANDN